jgi:hypothetical protein
MKYDNEIPKAVAKACSKTDSPFDLGVSIGRLLGNIEHLTTTHLKHDVNFQLPVPEKLQWAPDFVQAVTDHMIHLRTMKNLPDALENIPEDVYDRKAQCKQRKCKDKYAHLVQAEFKQCVREEFGDLFASWNPMKTQLFNQGVDKVLTKTRWKVYPLGNVALEAGDGNWAQWLEERCRDLGWAIRSSKEVLGKNVSGYKMWEICVEEYDDF